MEPSSPASTNQNEPIKAEDPNYDSSREGNVALALLKFPKICGKDGYITKENLFEAAQSGDSAIRKAAVYLSDNFDRLKQLANDQFLRETKISEADLKNELQNKKTTARSVTPSGPLSEEDKAKDIVDRIKRRFSDLATADGKIDDSQFEDISKSDLIHAANSENRELQVLAQFVMRNFDHINQKPGLGQPQGITPYCIQALAKQFDEYKKSEGEPFFEENKKLYYKVLNIKNDAVKTYNGLEL